MEKKFNLTAALERENEIKGRLLEIATAMETENREMTDAEKAEQKELLREQSVLEMKIAASRPNAMENREKEVPMNTLMRELLQDSREGKAAREITFGTQIKTQSGAINLTIKDVIPTINEGLGLPGSLKIVTGVTGNVLYPYGIDDAEFEEVGENASLTDQDLNFTQLSITSKRCGLSILVSNTAIDEASFDLMGYIQQKFTLALAKYLAKKVYSQAAWSGNKGPFSGITKAGTIDITNKKAYQNILEAVAAFVNKGFSANGVVLIMDALTEAKLKCTLKNDGVGGYIIENGKCAGYDYVVTHYINTVLGGDAKTASGNTDTTKLYPTTKSYLGLGWFNYEAVQQHGKVRMGIDSTSQAVMKINSTALVLNTEWSLTDLSTKVNGGNGKTGADATQAFAVYEIA